MEGCLKHSVYAFMVLLLLLHINMSPSLLLEYNNSDGTYVRCIESERQALLAFKEGFTGHGGNEELLSSWGGREAQKQDCCRWPGVYCNNQTNHVTQLDLRVHFLRGEISPKLNELQHLEYMAFGFDGSKFPTFIGSLTNLRYLDLYLPEFDGKFPYQLGNLTHLQYFSFLGYYGNRNCRIENLNWLPYLSSLKYLDLSYNCFSNVSDWLETVNKLPNLRTLTLRDCSLPVPVVSSLSHINSSKSLASVDLDLNPDITNPTLFKWLCNHNTSLVDIDLEAVNLSGSIPDVFENMRSLASLHLSRNNLEGRIPLYFSKLCSLRVLGLFNNNLSGRLSDFIQILSNCSQNSLEILELSFNDHIFGSLPNLTNFPSLKILSLSSNRLTGRVPESIGQMTNLEWIGLSNNSLEGTISEIHFSQLSRLLVLDISDNSLAFNVCSDWVPPFQLETIKLRSCKMGLSFPKWLQTQKEVLEVDISNAGISDILPSWFLDWSHKATYMDLSCNQIRGTLENLTLESVYNPGLNLSWNLLEGPIVPSVIFVFADLSNNKFSGSASFLCAAHSSILSFLDLSSNNLSGELPDCWTHFEYLVFLDLSNNAFSGRVPTTMGSLVSLETLKLDNNKFVGEFPSLRNCRNLGALGLENNKFSGPIPKWLAVRFPDLVILILRSNLFNGSIPSELCHLTSIHILDLSINNISGCIPKCLNNLTAMAQGRNVIYTSIWHVYRMNNGPTLAKPGEKIEREIIAGKIYEDEITITWKGALSRYKSTLELVKSVDLSSNKLTGEIPNEITYLVELVSLNLSRNHLTGQITREIGKLQSLNSLDLSRNLLHGTISPSLFKIYGLGYLDLSHNNLSGKIPIGSQLQSYDASSFAGNPLLCGLPLERSCSLDPENNPPQVDYSGNQEDHDKLITQGFYISLGLGFFVGFWGVCGSLIFNQSWRYAYYRFFDLLNDRLYVRINLIRRQLKNRLA